MSQPQIIVEGISKRYRIGVAAERYPTFREAIVGAVKAPLRRWRQLRESGNGEDTIWALKDVSFEVQPGEVLGIIGRNGAGKTTLLKILSRITEPTEGIARLRGRVASLLEVGTGFHPELSGRENIYLNGAILGMKRAEIDRKFDDIVAFAEVEKFLDTPVKRYSSGMYVRLAFAVAAHLEPEILIVDEVLAVGDAVFQKRCLGKMQDVASSEGRTVLFVSHNMVAVQNLCPRAIWIDGGELQQDGAAGTVVGEYLSGVQSRVTERVWPDFESAPGNETVRIRRAAIETAGGSENGPITTRTPLDVVFEFWNRKPGARLNLTVHLYGRGAVAFETGPVRDTVWRGKSFPVGLFRSGFRIPGDLLNDGVHSVMLLVVEDQSRVIYRHEDMLVFNVEDDGSDRGPYHGEVSGAVRPILHWQTELLEHDRSQGHPLEQAVDSSA